MKLTGMFAVLAASALLVGCGSSTPQPSENQLRQQLSGPPNLRALRDKMSNKPGAPAGIPASKIGAATTPAGK